MKRAYAHSYYVERRRKGAVGPPPEVDNLVDHLGNKFVDQDGNYIVARIGSHTVPQNGMVVHYDFSKTDTITLNVNKISAISDLSVNANDMSQTTETRQPRFSATGINNLGSAVFSSSVGSNLKSKKTVGITGATDRTYFVVSQAQTSPLYQTIFSIGRLVPNGLCNPMMYYANHQWILNAYGSGVDLETNYPNDAGVHIHEIKVSSNVATWRQDNLQIGPTFNHAYNTSENYMYLGAREGNNHYLNGMIGEVLVYDRAFTDQESESVYLYLSGKWGL